MLVQIEAYGESNAGLVRTGNEDSFLVDIPAGLLIVADGMGGHAGGEVASQMAVETLHEILADEAQRDLAGADAREAAGQAVSATHDIIGGYIRRHPDFQGMGTTVVLAWLRGCEVVLSHVGDSRAYLMRDGELRQLTEDHSWVAQMVRIGQLTEDEARTHPHRNIITQAVGAGNGVVPTVTPFEPVPGDVLLLCSDGLHGLVDDARILHQLTDNATPNEAVAALISDALVAGGVDNVTVVIARWAAA